MRRGLTDTEVCSPGPQACPLFGGVLLCVHCGLVPAGLGELALVTAEEASEA